MPHPLPSLRAPSDNRFYNRLEYPANGLTILTCNGLDTNPSLASFFEKAWKYSVCPCAFKAAPSLYLGKVLVSTCSDVYPPPSPSKHLLAKTSVSNGYLLLHKYNRSATVLLLLRMGLICKDAWLVGMDFGGELFYHFFDNRKLVRLGSDDSDDVDFSRSHLGRICVRRMVQPLPIYRSERVV